MQATDMQDLMAPYTRLAQANFTLFSRYASSPEVMAQALGQAQQMLRQPPQGDSSAAAELMFGLMRNWMQFLTELGQAVAGAGPAAFAQAAQSASAAPAGQATNAPG